MKHEIHESMDCLFTEIARLQKLNLEGTHLTPATIRLYQERLAKIFIDECRVALSPMLRDMISRGQAIQLIEQHFGVDK